jgi:hypothetical protein
LFQGIKNRQNRAPVLALILPSGLCHGILVPPLAGAAVTFPTAGFSPPWVSDQGCCNRLGSAPFEAMVQATHLWDLPAVSVRY